MDPEVKEMIQIALSALISLIGAATAWIALRAKKAAEEANDAVNHRHKKVAAKGVEVSEVAPPLKLYDLAWENHQKVDELIQWKRGYDGGPLDSGTKVEEFVEKTNSRLQAVESNIKHIRGSVEHCKEHCPVHEKRKEQMDK